MKRITSLLLICCLLAAMAGPVSAYDPSGITLLPGNIAQVTHLGYGLYSFQLDGSPDLGVMNVHGDVLLDAQYKWIEQRSTAEGEALVYVAQAVPVTEANESGELWGVMDAEGRWVLPCRYIHIGLFSEGLAFAELPHPEASNQRLQVFVDMQGNETSCPGYSSTSNRFSEGLAVMDDSQVINTKGEVLYSLEQYGFYEGMNYFSDGLMPVREPQSGLWGFIGADGEMAIPATFDDAGAFSGGLAPVCVDGKWGYIDTSGQIAIEPAYARAESFIGDAAAVYSEENGWMCIDMKGDFIAMLGDGSGMASDFEGFSDGWAVARRNGVSTLFDRSGQVHLRTEGIWPWGCKDGILQQLTQPVYGTGKETGVLIDTEGRRLTPEEWIVTSGDLSHDGYVIGSRVLENGDVQYASIKLQPSQEQPAYWAQAYIDGLKTETVMPAYLLDNFDGDITREAFAALLFNVWHSVTGEDIQSTPEPFDDLADILYPEQLSRAFYAGLVEGTGERAFSPHSPLTREQMAKMLCTAYLDVHGGTLPAGARPDFADSGDISSWAAPYVAFCQQNGLLDGTGDNVFAPKQAVDRQTALTAAAKLLERLK